MTPITQTIPNPFGGISQQPPIARSPSQAESMINMDPDVVEGIRRRFPTIFITNANVLSADNEAFIYVFPKAMTGGIEYVLVISQNTFSIINSETGAQAAISGGTAQTANAGVIAYVRVPNAARDLSVISVGDTSLLLNKNVVVTHEVHGAAPASTSVFAAFEDLPATGDPAVLYRIQTKAGARDSYYFVRWDAGLAAYVESFSGPLKKPDQDTMPLAISYVSENQFRLDYPDWKPQEVGDEVVIPVPSFYGRRIRDVFFFRNRLAFLTDTSVVMSRAGRYYDFYPRTVTEVFADDPVDVSAAHTSGVQFRYAVPFDSNVLIFGDRAQFQFSFLGSLDQSIPTLDPVTEFECADVRPARIGPNVYFAQKSPEGVRIREYFTRENAVTNDALDITEHVPNLINASYPSDLVSIPGADMLIVCDSQTRTLNTMGPPFNVFRARWNDEGRRVQSAWSQWTFGRGNLYLADPNYLSQTYCIAAGDNSLYMLFRDQSVYLVKMYFGPQPYFDRLLNSMVTVTNSVTGEVTQEKWIPSLDYMRRSIGATWNSGPDTTSISFRANIPTNYALTTVVDTNDGMLTDLLVEPIQGNKTYFAFLGGQPFDSEFTLSQIFLRGDQGQPNTGGRLKLKQIRALLKETGACVMRVKSYGRTVVERMYAGYELTPFNMLGAAIVYLRDRWLKFPLSSDSERTSITFKSVGVLPLTITAIEWTGAFFRRGSRR